MLRRFLISFACLALVASPVVASAQALFKPPIEFAWPHGPAVVTPFFGLLAVTVALASALVALLLVIAVRMSWERRRYARGRRVRSPFAMHRATAPPGG